MRPTTNESWHKVTRTILHTNILTSYNSKSASHEKDAKLERLQQQVAKLQQPFIKSQNDNKELK